MSRIQRVLKAASAAACGATGASSGASASSSRAVALGGSLAAEAAAVANACFQREALPTPDASPAYLG